MADYDKIEDIKRLLENLQLEHSDLDDVIDQLVRSSPVNHLQIQRLKKRKLAIKDQIARLQSRLLPDIIA